MSNNSPMSDASTGLTEATPARRDITTPPPSKRRLSSSTSNGSISVDDLAALIRSESATTRQDFSQAVAALDHRIASIDSKQDSLETRITKLEKGGAAQAPDRGDEVDASMLRIAIAYGEGSSSSVAAREAVENALAEAGVQGAEPKLSGRRIGGSWFLSLHPDEGRRRLLALRLLDWTNDDGQWRGVQLPKVHEVTGVPLTPQVVPASIRACQSPNQTAIARARGALMRLAEDSLPGLLTSRDGAIFFKTPDGKRRTIGQIAATQGTPRMRWFPKAQKELAILEQCSRITSEWVKEVDLVGADSPDWGEWITG